MLVTNNIALAVRAVNSGVKFVQQMRARGPELCFIPEEGPS